MSMRFLKGGIRFLMVTVGIIVLTSFTIDATDSFSKSQTALSILVGSALESECPDGMNRVDLVDKSICVDTYENSVGEKCPVTSPSFSLETKNNIDTKGCISVSVANIPPWTFVALHQAKALCVKREMRLPSASEWYEAGLGTPDSEKCNISGGSPAVAGSFDECISSRGVYDMIGNVWEWVDSSVLDGVYNDRILPESGYVAEIDTAGVVVMSEKTASEMFNSDYFYGDSVGVKAMMRGGFYAGGDDSGLFSVHAKVGSNFSSKGTGFRCVLTI